MELEELFESYLKGKMSSEDQALFEKLLKEDSEYQAQFNIYKLKVSKTSRSPISSFKNWSISIGIAVVIVLVGYFLFTTLSMAPGEKLFQSYYEPIDLADSTINSENPMVVNAISLYNKGQFEQAEGLLGNLASENISELALLYLGLCQLEIDRPEKAIPSLSRIPQKSDLFFQANWYSAMGFLKLNKLEEAKRHLLISASNPNEYFEKAEEILLKIKSE